VADFTKLGEIGMGTYGIVFKARCKKSQRLFALKQIKLCH
jgi:serine/threonine protein kinase